MKCLILALVLAGAAGCGKKSGEPPPSPAEPAVEDAGMSPAPERVLVTGVEVKVVDPTTGPERELYPRILAQRLGATLTESDWFVADGAEPPPGARLRKAVIEVVVGYSIVPEGSTGDPAIIAVVEASVDYRDGKGGMRSGMKVLAERGFTKDEEKSLDGLVAAHVERAVADAGQGIIAKERIRVGPEEEAIAALDSKDTDLRVWALAVVGDRRISDASDGVIARLSSPEEQERDAAIGALVALKDPRAVGALTHLAAFEDYALMRRVIDAVAILGGDEAIDYLEFVATGHPEHDIQQQAQQALERLRRKQSREQARRQEQSPK